MAGAPSTAVHLTLLRHGDTLTVDLADTGTLIPRSETRVDDGFLRDLAAEMAQAAARHGADAPRRWHVSAAWSSPIS